jgi:hypothetical protein
LQILDLILEGCSNQEINKATELSLGTVKNYVSAIFLALECLQPVIRRPWSHGQRAPAPSHPGRRHPRKSRAGPTCSPFT